MSTTIKQTSLDKILKAKINSYNWDEEMYVSLKTLKKALGCETDSAFISIYDITRQILSNWKKGRIHHSTKILLDLAICQHEIMSEEQKTIIIGQMTKKYL